MPTDVRTSFAAAGRCFAELVDRIPPPAFDGPGLGMWDLRSLVGHTGRALSTVITYLQRPAERVDVPDAVVYYELAGRSVGADPAAVTERGRQAGLGLGGEPARSIRALVDDALAALDAVSGDPLIQTIGGGMRLDAYLPTRTFELTVHTLDIAAATGLPVTVPPAALRDGLQLVSGLAIRRGDGEQLLLTLTGRRVLPGGYSVL